MTFNWFDHIYAIFLLIVVPFLSMRSVPDEDAEEWLPPKKHLFYSNGLMLIIGALLVITSWNISQRPWADLGIGLVQWSRMATYTSLAIVGFYFFDLLRSWIYVQETRELLKELSYLVPVNWREFRHYMFLAFAAGIGEEIIFRGFLIPYLNHLLAGWPQSFWWAIVIPAISFAFSHSYQGAASMIKIGVIAVLFGYLFVITESLLPVMILHVFIDIISGASGVWTTQSIKRHPASRRKDSD